MWMRRSDVSCSPWQTSTSSIRASSKFTYHERDELIGVFERVSDMYIEADLLGLASELGAEIDMLRELNRADDLSSPHVPSDGLHNSSLSGQAAGAVMSALSRHSPGVTTSSTASVECRVQRRSSASSAHVSRRLTRAPAAHGAHHSVMAHHFTAPNQT
jgi:hypothetical protein